MRTEDGYIIHRCLNGDSNAFGFLVDKYKAGVYAFAYERLHNFHDAEDISQEVFLKAYKSLRTLKRWDSFASWLYRITLNLCRNWIRAQSSRPDREFVEDQDPEVLEAHSRNTYRQELAYESVGEALDSLPEMYSQALTLHYFGGMTSMEIAKFTGVSPSAVRMRLRRARSLLKEEILTVMSTKYEQQRLQASFTFRILEAVKRMRIHPTPRTAGLPWGLSLATGIIVTFLTLTPQPSIINSVATATGSPLPVEKKVLKTGEIPVDVLETSEISFLVGEKRDNNNLGSKLTNQQTEVPVTAETEGDARTEESVPDDAVIIDPETGVRYTKVKILTGKQDIIKYPAGLSLSPDGKFLLSETRVIPLAGGDPFSLIDMPAWRGSWSPDGNKVAFYSEDAIWAVPVSPETGHSIGPAKKLLDGEYAYQRIVSWSPDSERIVFARRDEEIRDDIWTLSVEDGSLNQVTDDPVGEGRPVWSPDGKTIAYNWGDEIRLISVDGGAPRKVVDKGRPVSWSPDGKWLLYGPKPQLFRLADERVFEVSLYGSFLSWSPDGEKILSYSSSWDNATLLKVVSASGGSSFELGRDLSFWESDTFWSPDSKTLIRQVWNESRGRVDLWAIPLSGDEPRLLELRVSNDEPRPRSVSPDGGKLLFSVRHDDETSDLWVTPISIEDGRTTGSSTKVFSGLSRSRRDNQFSWSSDGTRIAITSWDDIWIVSAEGGEPIQVTNSKNAFLPVWSPAGDMIAYVERRSEHEIPLMLFNVSSGETTETGIVDISSGYITYTWSPDGREIAAITEGTLSAVPASGGNSRHIIKLRDISIDRADDLCWSPDGYYLAFIGDSSADGSYHIFLVPAEGGEVAELADDDPGDIYNLTWSPDGKWLSYTSDGFVKTRPGGIIWEVDVSEFLSSQ